MKEVSTQNPMSSENILQEVKGNQDILRNRKIGGFVNRKPTITKWLRKFSKQRKNDKGKNLGISGREKVCGKQKYVPIKIDFPFLEFSKLFYTIGAKVITLFEMDISACRENI